MGRRPSMTLNDRLIAIGMLNGGSSVNHVARHFQVHERTIYRLQSRYRQTNSVKDRPRSGRPKKTTQREDRYLVTSSRRNRFLTSTALANRLHAATGTRVSFGTVRNRLRAAALRGRRPLVGVALTQRHRRARLNWARAHLAWTRQQWSRVVFTDESRFNLQAADGRLRVWRRKGERFDAPNIAERDRFGGGSVMVWGGISRSGATQLVTVNGNLTAVGYRDNIIGPVILPYLHQGNADVLQHDNARPHTARVTQDFLRQNNVQVLDWPARSPDLSPIEHLWDCLGRKVRRRNDVNNLRDLERALHQEWLNIPLQVIRRLINSMRRRCLAVINRVGGHTRY